MKIPGFGLIPQRGYILEVMKEQSKQPWKGLDFLQIVFISGLKDGGARLPGPEIVDRSNIGSL